MGLRTLGVLLMVALGLAAVLYFTDAKPDVKVVADTAVLDGRSLHDIKRLWWQFKDRPPIEVTRQADGRMQLSEPLVDLASAARMKSMIDAWDSAHMRATPLADDADGRKKSGLESPELKLVAEWSDGKHIEVEVGDPGPLGNTRFLHRDGKIWEGGDGVIETMRVGLDDLRERQVFRNVVQQVRELEVDQQLASGKHETLKLSRSDNQWHLVSPVQGRADSQMAFRFLTAVLSLNVDTFLIGVVPFPDTEPALTVVVKGDQGEERLRMWDQNGQLYGQLPGRNVNFVADNRQYNRIFVNAADDLRAKILLPFEGSVFESMVECVLDPGVGTEGGGGERIRLLRESPTTDWRLVEPVEFAANATPCNELAAAINRLIAKEFVTDSDVQRPRAQDARYGLQAKDGRLLVSVRGVDERKVTSLWLGKTNPADPSMAFACRADEPDNVVLVPAEPLETLRRPWTDYCVRQVMKQGAAIERLDVVRGAETRTFAMDDTGHWLHDGKPCAEVGDMAKDDLPDLVGQRAVDLRGDKLGPATWTLRLMRRNGDQLGEMRVWDRGTDQPLVVQAGEPGPVGFELSSRLSRDLRALWQ